MTTISHPLDNLKVTNSILTKPVNINKTANKKEYMREYMNKKYNGDVTGYRKIKTSERTRRLYTVDDEICAKYKHNVHHIVALKQIIDDLPEGMFETFLLNHTKYNFPKKEQNI